MALSISKLTKKYDITDEQWRSCVKTISKHLLFENLFPKCDHGEADLVDHILTQQLDNDDENSEIYAMVYIYCLNYGSKSTSQTHPELHFGSSNTKFPSHDLISVRFFPRISSTFLKILNSPSCRIVQNF